MDNNLTDLLYELSNLNHIPRSGLVQFCFEDFESIAVHSYKVAFIAYFLAGQKGANREQVLTMAIFHDATETRVGDSNWIQKKYIKRDEAQALQDQYQYIAPELKKDLLSNLNEYELRLSTEAKIVKDADYLAYFLTLKELEVKGNLEAKRRLEYETKQLDFLFFAESKQLMQSILETDPNNWTRNLHKGTMKEAIIK